MVAFSNLAVDVVYGFIDPRIGAPARSAGRAA